MMRPNNRVAALHRPENGTILRRESANHKRRSRPRAASVHLWRLIGWRSSGRGFTKALFQLCIADARANEVIAHGDTDTRKAFVLLKVAQKALGHVAFGAMPANDLAQFVRELAVVDYMAVLAPLREQCHITSLHCMGIVTIGARERLAFLEAAALRHADELIVRVHTRLSIG